ncbi:MAG TPA: hypothetical protein V6C85_29115 [Allocoleopsis sp.]
MFGFIKNLFSGIAAFFGGLFGGKKSQGDASDAPKSKKSKGYYLQLDEAETSGPLKTEKKPEPVAAATAAPAKAEAAEAKTPEPAKAAVATASASQPTKEVPTGDNGKVTVAAQPNPPAPANVVASNGKVDAPAEQTFAPKYLTPTATSSRRRPGPSLDMFRDMARQVKTPG